MGSSSLLYKLFKADSAREIVKKKKPQVGSALLLVGQQTATYITGCEAAVCVDGSWLCSFRTLWSLQQNSEDLLGTWAVC